MGMDEPARMTMVHFLVFVLTCVLLADSVVSKPISVLPDQRSGPSSSPEVHWLRKRSPELNDNVLMYLMKFGYLPQSDIETGNLRTEDQIRDAIKTMQAFAGITVTGKVDEETRELMRRPRCGLPDIISDSYRSRRSAFDSNWNGHKLRHQRHKRYTVQGQRWHHTNLTWSVRKSTTDMDPAEVRFQVQRALDLWSKASRLTFREVNSDDADIRVSFHTGFHNDGYPFDGKGTLLAHAFFPGSGIGGDAHFDDDEPWVPHDGGLSFFGVAVHEFGHSLGLSHSSVEGAIMFPYYQAVGDNYTLSTDDITGIQAIYGSRHEGRVTNPAMTTTTTSPVPTKSPTKKPIYPPSGPKHPPAIPPSSTPKPNTCDTSYDAISVIRSEVFVFKGRYFWRLGKDGLVYNYPVAIDRFWYGLPWNLTHIDAIYEKKTGQREIIIFIGRQFWKYPSNDKGQGPFPLTDLGLPEDLEKLDGAMVWGHNGKTYFFSGSMYWRFDEEAGTVELDYPRDMSMWKGVPYNIDAVFQYTDGKTYFFKGKVFWEFNDRKMAVVSRTPNLSAPFWMSCPTGMDSLESESLPAGDERLEQQNFDGLSSESDRLKSGHSFIFISTLFWLVASSVARNKQL